MFLISHGKSHTYLAPSTTSDIRNFSSMYGIVLWDKKKRRNGIKRDSVNVSAPVTSIGNETLGSESDSVL